MINKLKYSLKTRGILGSLKLLQSYFYWYVCKIFSKDRRFLKEVNGYKMYLNLDDPGLSTTVGRGGSREKDQAKVLVESLKPGMTVLDIGANLGYYALMEATVVGTSGKVYAVEPVPSNYKFLSMNVRLNSFDDRIETFQMAVSDKNASQKLYLSKLSNLNTLFIDGREEKQAMTGESIEVKTMRVDSFVKGKRKIDLIRMDIEGAEVEVLTCLNEAFSLDNLCPTILFETHRTKYNQSHSLKRPLEMLFEKGYFVKKLISNSDDGWKWADIGYVPEKLVATDGQMRGIYSKVSNEDALDLICDRGGVRAVLLEYRNKN